MIQIVSLPLQGSFDQKGNQRGSIVSQSTCLIARATATASVLLPRFCTVSISDESVVHVMCKKNADSDKMAQGQNAAKHQGSPKTYPIQSQAHCYQVHEAFHTV